MDFLNHPEGYEFAKHIVAAAENLGFYDPKKCTTTSPPQNDSIITNISQAICFLLLIQSFTSLYLLIIHPHYQHYVNFNQAIMSHRSSHSCTMMMIQSSCLIFYATFNISTTRSTCTYLQIINIRYSIQIIPPLFMPISLCIYSFVLYIPCILPCISFRTVADINISQIKYAPVQHICTRRSLFLVHFFFIYYFIFVYIITVG